MYKYDSILHAWLIQEIRDDVYDSFEGKIDSQEQTRHDKNLSLPTNISWFLITGKNQ